MFEFLFKYPRAVFSKGELVLLGAWPKWVLALFLLAAAAGLAWLIRSRLPQASPHIRTWKAGAIWLLQFALAALLLILLWQPAIMVAAAEYHCSPGGRLAQHGHRGYGCGLWSDARVAGR